MFWIHCVSMLYPKTRNSPCRILEPGGLVGAGWLPGCCAGRAVRPAAGSVCKPPRPGPAGPGYHTPQPATGRKRGREVVSTTTSKTLLRCNKDNGNLIKLKKKGQHSQCPFEPAFWTGSLLTMGQVGGAGWGEYGGVLSILGNLMGICFTVIVIHVHFKGLCT